MNSKSIREIVLGIFLVCQITSLGSIPHVRALPMIAVNPVTSVADPPDSFSINITITGAVDLFALEIFVGFDENILAAESVEEGHFIRDNTESPDGTHFDRRIFDNYVYAVCLIIGPYPGVSGDGTLFIVTFRVKAPGVSDLHIYDVVLIDSTGTEMSCATSDGYFHASFNFVISVFPASLTIVAGDSDTSTITVASLTNFNSPVALSASGLPTGAAASFIPASVTPPPGGTAASTLTIGVGPSTSPGDYTVAVTGTSITPASNHSAIISLTVLPSPDFSISASPTTISINQGGTITSTITITSLHEFDSTVDLAISALPSGITGSFSPTPISPPADGSATSTLTINVDLSTVADTFTLTVEGTSGVLTHSTSLILTVNPIHDIAVTNVSAEPEKVLIGEPVTITVVLENQGGFDETFAVTAFYDAISIVTETITNLPSGTSTTLAFTWDTTNVTFGNYAIRVEASVVPGEEDLSDNIFTDGTITVAFQRLFIRLVGEFDYLRAEPVEIRLAALVKDAETMEAVSSAQVDLEIYDPNGMLWISEPMMEMIPRSGIYEWSSAGTIGHLRLSKGVYLVRATASLQGGQTFDDILMFHIDPPAEEDSQALYYLPAALAVLVGMTGMIVKRKKIASVFHQHKNY